MDSVDDVFNRVMLLWWDESSSASADGLFVASNGTESSSNLVEAVYLDTGETENRFVKNVIMHCLCLMFTSLEAFTPTLCFLSFGLRTDCRYNVFSLFWKLRFALHHHQFQNQASQRH